MHGCIELLVYIPTLYLFFRWNNHPVNLVSVFTGLYHSETLVDVTLAAEGKHLQAHKMLLSACSDYFQSLFSVNPCQHPIVILKDVRFEDLQTVVQFMYNGIVNVSSEKLPDILKVMVVVNSKYYFQVATFGTKYVHRMWAFFFSKSIDFPLSSSTCTTYHKTLLIAIFLNLGKK